MIELYKAEFRRFFRWAVGLAVLHASGLFLLDRTFPWMRHDAEIAFVIGFAYAVVGGIFGFYQSASYARANHWIALLHRPLAPWRIMGAVKGASATLLFAAVAIPLLIFTAGLASQVDRVVDARHWPLALAAGLLALIGFGIGSFLALAPRRYGWTVLVAVFGLLIVNRGAGPAAVLLPLLIILALVLLMAGAFKPDRGSSPSWPVLLAATAGVAGLSIYFILAGLTGLVYEIGLTAAGQSPETAPPDGGVIAATRADGTDLIADGLASASTPEALALLARMKEVESIRLPAPLGSLPRRGELTDTGPISFTDSRRGIQWTYSHDSRAFEGARVKDRSSAGRLKPADGFSAPPLLVGSDGMIAGNTLYQLDDRSGQLEPRFHVPMNERIVSAPYPAGPFVSVLSDRALYLLDGEAFEDDRAPDQEIVVPLPGMAGDLHSLHLARPESGLLVSFLFGRDSVDGPDRAWQAIVSVDREGRVEPVARQSLAPDHPAFLRFRSHWISPAFRAVVVAVQEIGTSGAWIAPRAPVEVPRSIWTLAGVLSLAAAGATVMLAKYRKLRTAETAAWTLAALCFGLPMFLAFWLIRRNRDLTVS